ncbi:MAG: PIN domain nuclease [bacterium]|nr:PIN domain nuclease [bacterium]
MILVDTSAWVEFDRATGSTVDERLSGLIADDAEIAVTEPVIMEVTAGARTDAREQDLRRLLGRCSLLRFDAAVDFDAASRIYRTCRRSGVTPRGMIDCMIASVAHRYNATLLVSGADLQRIAEVIGIPLDDDHL